MVVFQLHNDIVNLHEIGFRQHFLQLFLAKAI